MKTFLILFALLCTLSFAGQGDKVIKDTTINKVVYHIYLGSRGGKYIVVTSRTGKEYRKYLKTN